MNFLDIMPRQDYELLQYHAKNRNLYQFEKFVKTADGKIGISIEFENIDKELADELWGGDTLLIHVSFDSRRTNLIGSAGRAFSSIEFANKLYEDFAEYIEKIGSYYFPKNYERYSSVGEQLSFFEV